MLTKFYGFERFILSWGTLPDEGLCSRLVLCGSTATTCLMQQLALEATSRVALEGMVARKVCPTQNLTLLKISNQ